MLILCFLLFALCRLTFSNDTLTTSKGRFYRDPEFRLGLLFVLGVPVLLMFRHFGTDETLNSFYSFGDILRIFWGAVFTVLSFLSTTGFESADWAATRAWSGLGSPGMSGRGRDAGERAFLAGQSAKSHLIKFVSRADPDNAMPPEGKGEPLNETQVETLRKWIDEGAKIPGSEKLAEIKMTTDHWSFQPVSRDGFEEKTIDEMIGEMRGDKALTPSHLFFFKQKTAYEISACLVSSEMCIGDGHHGWNLN